MTGTMLLIDAWFDVLTTHRGGLVVSILMAVFAEIPCALICFYVSRRITNVFEQTKDYFVAAGFTVRNGRVVPPAGFPRNVSGLEPAAEAADPGPVVIQSSVIQPSAIPSSERGLGAPVGQQGLLAEQL